MKKIFALLMAVLLMLSVIACGQTSGSDLENLTGKNDAVQPDQQEKTEDETGTENNKTGWTPEKTITFIVPYAAGDGTDILCRALTENIDLPVDTVVENVTGASGTIGTMEGFNRPHDGYTVNVVSVSPLVSQVLLNDTLTYTLEDWKVIANLSEPACEVLVTNSDNTGISTSEEFKSYAESGAHFTCGTATMAGFGYTAAVSLFYYMGIYDNVTFVTYDGAAELYQAYLSGEIDFAVMDDNFAKQYVNAGDFIDILLALSANRSQFFPDVACAEEWGLDKCGANLGFKALAVPADTSDEIVDYLVEKINEAVISDDYQQFLEDNWFGTYTELWTPEECQAGFESVMELYKEIFTLVGLI